jgi:non-specific serine/threonine protein kinase
MSERLPLNSQISHYRILSKIGEGGMGEVWLAEDTRLGRKVALKLLPAEFTEDSERVRRFTQEAKAASALNHPNIISVYDIGESESGRFIVMEFVAGRTLRSVIAKDNSLETFFTLGAQMAKALSGAHAAGITHRDIKPDNIMVREDGYVKMLDFGLARLLPTTSSDPEAMTLAQQTTPGTVMGTLAYMSPEQASGQTVGSPSDVFALGIVLYQLATGSHPFKSETMIGYLHAITSQTPPSMTSLKSNFPPALDDLILRMLDKDASRRPMASEVAQALQEIERYGSSKTFPIRIAADKPKARSEEEGFWVAVLPFKYRGANADIETLAEGLSEDILTGLSRFSYLRVIARGSTLRYANQTTDLRIVGKELCARYVMEGTLRQAGTKLRLAVQLVDATTGAHLWAENYEREFSPENIFELQDDLVPRIVSTVADWYGALPHSMSERVRLKAPEQLSPYEALLRSFGYFENIAPEEHAMVRSSLERAVEQEPGNADLWAMLSMLFGEEHRFGFNVEPDSLGRSLDAARKAVGIAHANHFAWLALAQALFFRREFDPFRDAAERAIALNPMDGSTVEYLGHLIAFSGNWERGCELAERARQLNPNHPSWYWSVPFLNAYRKGDYLNARLFITKGNPQKNYLMHALLAAVNGQLGESDAATRHLREVLTMMPDFPSIGRAEFSKWYLPELVDHLMDGLRKAGLETKAGLEITDEDRPADASSALQASGEKRADEGFWIAVLPFKFTGSNTEVATFAEGLSEEIVTGLNRFSYLRVIARSSTLRYANQTSDVRTVGKTLGARYVMEGNVRQVGSVIRVTVQLVDASTGVQLWAETYDRAFKPEGIFALQDDLVPRIVSTVADQHGVLPRSMSEVVRAHDPDQLTAYETLLPRFPLLRRRNC